MRILLTGADGFLGRIVTQRLVKSGHQVLGVTRRSPTPENFLHCDLAVPQKLLALLDEHTFDCVVNLAARIDFSAGALARMYAINVLCPALLAHHCADRDIHLVHASSIAVHGTQATLVSVDSPIKPDSDYGVSKALAEQIIGATGTSAAIIRFPGIFGSSRDTHLGLNRSIAATRNGVAPALAGAGTARRNYLYVADAAVMIERALNARLVGFYCAAGETLSIAAMLQKLCDQWLPGKSPMQSGAAVVKDQLVLPSPELGAFRSFTDALKDIDDEDRTIV